MANPILGQGHEDTEQIAWEWGEKIIMPRTMLVVLSVSESLHSIQRQRDRFRGSGIEDGLRIKLDATLSGRP